MKLDHPTKAPLRSPEGAALLAKWNEAVQRAVPVTRLVDYGVPVGDALAIHALTSGDLPRQWQVVCQEIADLHVQEAQAAFASGAHLTAAEEWRQAAAVYQAAQLAFNRDTAEKADLWRRARQAMQACAGCSQGLQDVQESRIRELRIDTGQGELYGWEVAPSGVPPQAAVIVIGGLSGWGSVYLAMARSLASRGVSCLLAEGPGQGSTRLLSGIHLSATTFPLFRSFVDHAQQRGAQRVGVWGNSFGGLFAARLAAGDSRVSAVCINGAPMAPAVPSFRTAREQMEALFGVTDEADVASALAALRLDAARDRIEAALLIVEGGQDPLVPLGAQHEFLALAPGRGTVMSWPDGQHTIYNHWEQRNARVSDWFCTALAAPGP